MSSGVVKRSARNPEVAPGVIAHGHAPKRCPHHGGWSSARLRHPAARPKLALTYPVRDHTANRLGGRNLAHVTIASDLNGGVFSVDHSGALLHNHHTDGRGKLRDRGYGAYRGSGWASVRHLAVMRIDGRVLLAGVGGEGELVATHADEADAIIGAPVRLDAGASLTLTQITPRLRRVFVGPQYWFYMITTEGALIRQRLIPTPSALQPTVGPYEVIEAEGWADALALFANPDGVFFRVGHDGFLSCQVTTQANDRPARAAWSPLARGWTRHHDVFAGGVSGNEGRIYAIGSEGSLEVRRYTLQNGAVTLAPKSAATAVGASFYPWGGLAADVEGYCWPLSASPGETIDFWTGVRLSLPPDGVNADVTEPATYTVDVRRLRRMRAGVLGVYDDVKDTPLDGESFTAIKYELPPDFLSTGARWGNPAFSLTIPDGAPGHSDHWPSGMYAARCTDSSLRDFYIPFIVRTSAARKPFAVIANTNTWNTYNSWGGYGKYTHTYPVPETLPFLRPNPSLTPDVPGLISNPRLQHYGLSIEMNSCHLLRAELWVLGWLEDLGLPYAFDVYTDQDLHDGIAGISDGSADRYRALILNTHPEYWTCEMYDRAIAYRDRGGSILYLGGNGLYEEVAFSENREHLHIFPRLDRSTLPADCDNEDLRLYSLMRTAEVRRPEHALLGVGFQHFADVEDGGRPYILLQDPTAADANPVLRGVDVKLNDAMGVASMHPADPASPATPASPGGYHGVGWEVDKRSFGTPSQAYARQALLAHDENGWGAMVCYRTDAGGLVFSASSLNFPGALVTDRNLQRIVQNALDLCRA